MVPANAIGSDVIVIIVVDVPRLIKFFKKILESSLSSWNAWCSANGMEI
jgi:hypothetical protein